MFLRTLRFKVYKDLSAMGSVLGTLVTEHPLYAIYTAAESQLAQIGDLMNTGAIRPWVDVRTSYDERAGDLLDRALRLGVLPTAADPLHWGHILIGLSAMSQLRLDKVIYIISGPGRQNQEVAPAAIRHPMARDVLSKFDPLFAYSSIGRDTSLQHEAAFLELLALNNPYQRIDAFYIAGADYYGGLQPGRRLMDIVAAWNAQIRAREGSARAMHTAAAVCVQRDDSSGHGNSVPGVHHLPPLPFAASSSMIRQALKGSSDNAALALLPFSAYVDVRAFRLYGHLAPPESSDPLLAHLPASCALEAENSL